MSLTTDPNSPCLKKIQPDGQQSCYLVLSEEERAKGFVRPVRRTYKHVGIRPKYPTQELTSEQHERYDSYRYVAYEPYPESESPAVGRFWTKAQLESGCNCETRMGDALAETFAAKPAFYGGTFCCQCGKHFAVEEFVWVDDGTVVGS
jgi:hypothetical protein